MSMLEVSEEHEWRCALHVAFKVTRFGAQDTHLVHQIPKPTENELPFSLCCLTKVVFCMICFHGGR